MTYYTDIQFSDRNFHRDNLTQTFLYVPIRPASVLENYRLEQAGKNGHREMAKQETLQPSICFQ